MGVFTKALKAAMPMMIRNPMAAAVTMGLSLVKGQKTKKVTKGKNKITVKKSKIVSKKQREMFYRVCESTYGMYIRGVTTVSARYIGHPNVAIPASEMIKKMMEEAAPPVNRMIIVGAKQQQKIVDSDVTKIIEIYKNAFNEREEYLKENGNFIDNRLNLYAINGTIQSVQYLMDKYYPELKELREGWKQKKDETFTQWYENTRKIYMEYPEALTIMDKVLFDIPINEEELSIFGKVDLTVNSVVGGAVKEIAAGANGIMDILISPLDTAEALTSPNAGSMLLSAMTEEIEKDWEKGTIQGRSQAVGRGLTIAVPILKSLNAAKTTKTVGKVAGKTAQETAEEAAERAARETAQEATERAARETTEEAVEKAAKEIAQETAEEAAERAAKETTQEAVERVAKETAEETTTTLNKVVREESGKTGGDGVQTSGPVRETKIDEVKNTGTENIGDIKQVRIEGRRKIYTNPSGNEVSWVDQSPKDIQAIINSKLKSSIDGDILEGQVAQAVEETGMLKGCGLKIETANQTLAGDIDVLTDSYIIEVKKSLGAVKKGQFDKLTSPNHPNYFNFDGKDIIYYIEDITTDKPYKKKALEMLQNAENVTVVHTLDELKGVLLQ